MLLAMLSPRRRCGRTADMAELQRGFKQSIKDDICSSNIQETPPFKTWARSPPTAARTPSIWIQAERTLRALVASSIWTEAWERIAIWDDLHGMLELPLLWQLV